MSILSWTTARLYDLVMQRIEAAGLASWREQLCLSASGRTLEIGAGTGANLAYYPDNLEELHLCEPDRQMRKQLQKKLPHSNSPFFLYTAKAEHLPFPDNSFDTVITTLVLCSVASPQKAADELFRVLKTGGTLLVIEHVLARDSQHTVRWQKRIEPFWHRCAGNCHLTRDTLDVLSTAGFNTSDIRHDILPATPFWAAPAIRGVARKR